MPRMLEQLRSLLPPHSLLGRVRWLFLVLALFNVITAILILALTGSGPPPLQALGAGALLFAGGLWVRGYRSGHFPLLFDLLIGLVLLLLVLGAGEVQGVIGVFYAGLLLRSLYGTRTRVAIATGVYLGAFLAAVEAVSHWNLAVLVSAAYADHVVAMPVIAGLLHLISTTLSGQDLAVHRQGALSRAGTALVAADDRVQVYQAVREALEGVTWEMEKPYAWMTLGSASEQTVVAAVGAYEGDVVGRRIKLADLPLRAREAIIGHEHLEINPVDPNAVRRAIGLGPDLADLNIVPIKAGENVRGTLAVAAAISVPTGVKESLLALSAEVALALERTEMSERLKRSEERFRSLVQNSSDLIMVLDLSGVITYASPALERILGYDPERLLGSGLVALLDQTEAADVLMRCLGGDRETTSRAAIQCRMRRRDGSWRFVEMTPGDLLEGGEKTGVVLNARDITDRKTLEEALRHQAFHDPLTGLANRQLFHDRVAQALARASRRGDRAAVLYVDLDDFKLVNDSLGHAAGDKLLAEVALRINSCLRTGDTAARLGGDEFAVLLEGNPSLDDASSVAQRILAILAEPFAVGGSRVHVGASVGVALSGDSEISGDNLLRQADVAMYTAKGSGKGRFEVFQPAMGETVAQRVRLDGDLRRALDREELALHYQPIVHVESGRYAGVEALVRWRHPTRGTLVPADFLFAAEQSGLILDMGRWVLRTACRQLVQWRTERPDEAPDWIAVNISQREVQSADLVEEVAAALAETGLPPACLVLETTEAGVLPNLQQSIDRLARLAETGVRLAIDDFGSGYSSLAYLRRYPVHQLKIDRSFLHHQRGDSEDLSLVRGMVRLGAELGLDVVVEGVEKDWQLTRLRRRPHLYAQGFLYSRPVPAEEFERLPLSRPKAVTEPPAARRQTS